MLAPPGLVTGDLLILEPTTGALSDILRFDSVRAGVFVYSDNFDGVDAPADVGFPTGLYPNMFTTTEVGPEGANGITYVPIAGQPGFVAGAAGPVTYVFLSDGQIPEPSRYYCWRQVLPCCCVYSCAPAVTFECACLPGCPCSVGHKTTGGQPPG